MLLLFGSDIDVTQQTRANVGLMLGRRRRRWANISPTLARVCWVVTVVIGFISSNTIVVD